MKKRLIADSFIALLGAALLFLLFMHYGRIQFGGMDGSVLVNSAWMLKLGYRPYSDFLTAVPPLFLLGAKLIGFFDYDLSWISFLEFTALFSMAAFVCGYFLLRKIDQPRGTSFIASMLVQLCGLGLYTVWWYNAATSSVCALLLLALLVLTIKEVGLPFRCLIVLLQALALISKVNSGIPTFLFSSIFLTLIGGMDNVFRRSLFYTVVPIALAYLMLRFADISSSELLLNYQDWAGRIENLKTPFSFLRIPTAGNSLTYQNYAVLAPLLLLAVKKVWDLKSGGWFPTLNGRFFLVLFSLFLFLQSIILDNDLKLSLACSLILLMSVDLRFRFERWTYFVFSILALIYSSYAIHSRQRVEAVGPGAFHQELCEWRIADFWSRFCGSEVFWKLNDDLISVVNKYQLKERAKVFFGPRIDFAYAYFGIKPIRGLPLWWEAYSKKLIRNFNPLALLLDSDVDAFVFFQNDMTFLPDIQPFLKLNYTLTREGTLFVYTKKAINDFKYNKKD